VFLCCSCAAALPAQQTPPAFKAETNLVLVPVVVRDAKGDAVANLTKADFHLFDNGKEQAITSFQVEETSGQVAQDRSQPDANTSPASGTASMVIPEHYVALLFDDQHIKNCNPDPPPGYIGCIGDLWSARDAARKMIKTLKPADRVGVFTSSGQVTMDFTADRAKIEESLMKLREGRPVMTTVPGSGTASRELENQTEEAVRYCVDIVRRMSHLPGQRTLVFVSPGLLLQGASWSSVGSSMNLIDNAIRSRVVINSLDARGLSPVRAGSFSEFQQRITDGTGGAYIRDTNDLKGGMERHGRYAEVHLRFGLLAAGYVKQDGSFHRLTVQLRDQGTSLDVQARAGYNGSRTRRSWRAKSRPSRRPRRCRTHRTLSETETQQVAQALGIAAQATAATGSRPTFRAETNLVLVPAVVRDAQGDA
jgi:VWFA-related protein